MLNSSVLLSFSKLSPPLGGSLFGCPCIYEDFSFLDWMGFDREAKRHFLTAFLISLAFFVESCICDDRTRALSQSYINGSRQIDVNWNRG